MILHVLDAASAMPGGSGGARGGGGGERRRRGFLPGERVATIASMSMFTKLY